MIPVMSFCYLIYLNNNQLCLHIILVMSQESRTQSSNQTPSKNFIETEWKSERSTYSHEYNVTGQERLTWPVMQEQSLADIIFFNCILTSSSIPTISIYPPLNPHLTKQTKIYNEMQKRAVINCNSWGRDWKCKNSLLQQSLPKVVGTRLDKICQLVKSVKLSFNVGMPGNSTILRGARGEIKWRERWEREWK